MDFNEKIRRLRRAAHLTQIEAAAEIGISMRGYQDMELGTLPRYEKGFPDLRRPAGGDIYSLRRVTTATSGRLNSRKLGPVFPRPRVTNSVDPFFSYSPAV